jgi:formate-dependent nitrite reductase membrane component NrfD
VQREAFMVRKPEKGTGPKVFYLGADEASMRPEIAARPILFKEGQAHLRPIGSPEPDPHRPGDPRVDYDVPHKKAWGIDLVLYLVAKGISTGTMFLSAVFWLLGDRSPLVSFAGPFASLAFALGTAVVLIVDLERPERFYYILTRPNWKSWLTRGAVLLSAHGAVAGLWVLFVPLGWTTAVTVLAVFALLTSIGATAYTGFLFAQGLARDLWQGPHATIDLLVQAAAEGSAAMLIVATIAGGEADTIRALALTLAFASLAHVAILTLEHLLTPSPTIHHELAVRVIRYGAYRQTYWVGALGLGGLAPILLVLFSSIASYSLVTLVAASLLALAGSLAWGYVWVEAGQAVPNS